MAKILLINPNKWGRGITHLWIASHSSLLKRNGHNVKLFDSTFYKNWSLNEIEYQSKNKQYKKSTYDEIIKYKNDNIYDELQSIINDFPKAGEKSGPSSQA